MPRGIFTKLQDVTLPDTFERLLHDPLDAPGVFMIHDFANSESMPSSTIGYQGTAAPTYAYSLARQPGGLPPDYGARFIGSGAQIGYDGRGLKFSRPNGTAKTDYAELTGPTPASQMTACLTQPFLAILWGRPGTVGDKYQGVMGAGGDQNNDAHNNAFALYLTEKTGPGTADYPAIFQVRDQNNVKTELGVNVVGGGLAVGQLIQIAFAVFYGASSTNIRFYVNGVQVASRTVNGMTSMHYADTPIFIGAAGSNQQGACTVHRTLFQFVSAANAAAVVAYDYQQNLGRFG